VTALRNAIEIDPKSPLYHSDLGAALSRLSKLEESEREYRRAIELDPGFVNAHYNLANLLARVGNLSGAAAEYSEVIQIMPAHPNVHFDLSRVLYRQGKLDEAIRELQEEVRHDPRAARAYSALVILYCEKGEYSVAAEVVKRADSLGLEIAPDALATLRRVSPGGDE
jgi:tetratricopeptide (TPR) repeat protein